MAALCPSCFGVLGRIKGPNPGFYCPRCGLTERADDEASVERVGPFGPGPKGLRPRLDPPSVEEWTQGLKNAHQVVADLYPTYGGFKPRSLSEAIERAVHRQTVNPMVSKCEVLDVIDDDTRVRLLIWREEDRLYEPDPDEAPEPGVIELRLRPGWEDIVDRHVATVAEALDEGASVPEAIERANESVQGRGDDG